MSTVSFFIISSILLVAILVVSLYFRQRFLQSRNVEYKVANDPTAQSAYYAEKHKNDNKKLSLKEKIELSWKFLYDLSEIIIKKFSPSDKESVTEIGKTLINNGMKYEHIIELGLPSKPKLAIEMEKKKDQNSIGF